MIKSSSRRIPLEWRQLGTDMPFCKPPCYEEPFISWDLLSTCSHPESHDAPFSQVYGTQGSGKGQWHKRSARICKVKKFVGKAFARCWCWSKQEERASGNSPASSGALQMKQSQEPQGSSCQWHSPPPPFLPAWLHGCGGGELEKWRGYRWDSTFSNSTLERKLEAGWYRNSQILFFPVDPEKRSKKKGASTQFFLSHSHKSCPSILL